MKGFEIVDRGINVVLGTFLRMPNGGLSTRNDAHELTFR
jgi:hypothetical protein